MNNSSDISDSVIKLTKGWEMSSKIYYKDSTYVRTFSGANVRSMEDYVEQYIRDKNPDHIVIQVGTNDLNSENNPEKIAKSILQRVVISEKRKVAFSEIIFISGRWIKDAEEVKRHLKDMCKIATINCNDNSSFNFKKHLSNSYI